MRRTNPIERVWRHLHEATTRNHRCTTLNEPVRQAFGSFSTHNKHDVGMHHPFGKAA